MEGVDGLALVRAAHEGDIRRMVVCLNAGVDVQSSDSHGRTALHWACTNGNMAAVNLLLRNGADVNTKNRWGRSPLRCATYAGHMEIAAKLLKKGAISDADERKARAARAAKRAKAVAAKRAQEERAAAVAKQAEVEAAEEKERARVESEAAAAAKRAQEERAAAAEAAAKQAQEKRAREMDRAARAAAAAAAKQKREARFAAATRRAQEKRAREERAIAEAEAAVRQAQIEVAQEKERAASAVAAAKLAQEELLREKKRASGNHDASVQLLDQIHVGPKIGEGNFGAVYSGTWLEVTDVALKRCKMDELESFVAEVRVLSNMKHPNVVQFFGVYKEGPDDNDDAGAMGVAYMVMELLPEGSVEDYLRRSPELPMADRVRLCLYAARGMVYLHNEGIVHCDLAARNLLCKQEGGELTCKVADFGLSIATGAAVAADAKVPVRWTAPESLESHKYTRMSDVWSFGVTAWEIVSGGMRPYPGLRNRDIAKHVAAGKRMAAPVGCPESLALIMELCWHLDPQQRPTMKQIASELKELHDELLAVAAAAGATLDVADSAGTDAANLSGPVFADQGGDTATAVADDAYSYGQYHYETSATGGAARAAGNESQ